MQPQQSSYLNFARLITSQVKTDQMNIQLSKPTKQLAEIFYLLYHRRKPIGFGEIYEHTHSRAIGQRIGDWRKLGLEIPCKETKTTNKFGNPTSYGEWMLTSNDREIGVKIYEKINKK